MARQKKNRGSSYKPQEYFRGVKSSVDETSTSGRSRGERREGRRLRGGKGGLKERFVGVFIAVIVLGGLLLVGYVDSSNISIEGASPYEESELATRVQAYLDSSPIRRLKSFVSSDALLTHVQETHPDVAQTQIRTSAFSPTAEVVLTMRSPALIWQNQDGAQLAVDVNGLAYADFDPQYHSDLDIIVSDATQPSAQLSDTVLSTQTVRYIQNLDTAVHQEANIKSHTYELPLGAREIRLKLRNYDIRFSLDRFEQEQAQELGQLLRNLNRRKIVPSEYIDLRAEDRAYYR